MDDIPTLKLRDTGSPEDDLSSVALAEDDERLFMRGLIHGILGSAAIVGILYMLWEWFPKFPIL